MSVVASTVVWNWVLPATEKLVALKLADYADKQGRNAFPAVATIAIECGLSERGVQKALRRLVGRCCVEVQRDSTNRRSTVYRVLLNAPIERIEAEIVPADDNVGVNDVHPEGRTLFTSRGERRAPQRMQGRTTCTSRGEPGSPLGANDVHPIRQGSVSDPSRARTREGRRPHPLDEAAVLSVDQIAAFDELVAVYPNDRGPRQLALEAWRVLSPSAELARFIVAHVRMRVADGWVKDGKRFAPFLWRFIEQRRWEERASEAADNSAARDGMFTCGPCPSCGVSLDGVWRGGRQQLAPCSRCTPSTEVVS